MTRRRYIPPPGYKASTKGHSVLKKWAYGARPFGHVEYDDAAYVERYVPSFVPLHSHYDTGREERDITRHVDSEIYLSSNLMDDVYDTAKKSHNKDAALLREATNAVPPSKRKYHRFDENEMSDITLRRFKSSYVPYQKRTAKAIQPPTNADDGITTRHLKATRVSKKPINTYTPLGTLASRSWKSSKPPPRSYQEETIKHPPDYFDNLISSIPAFTQAIGNIQVSPIPSLTGSPYGSPYMTPRMSPERELGNNNASAPPPQAKPQRRGLRSKHNVGSYYRKLLKRRAANPNRKSKYWPYYDVESIGNSDVAGLVSDDEYEDEYDNNQEGYNYDAYPRDEYYEGPGNTYYVYDTAPSQSLDEYVPFVPRRHNFEDEEDYKCTLPDLPDLGVAPYVPADKNGGSGISEDMAFHNLVAQTASKARRALRDINFNQYDNASLIFSVEGEYTHPERGDVLGFQYIARPLPLKGPNLATGPASSAVRMSDDNSFYKYLNTMRDFRNEIRQRLESGYAALRDVTKTIPSYSSYKPIEPPSASAFKYSYPSHVSTYRNELEGGFGGSISLYPISSRAKTEVALPSAAKEAVPDHTHQVELFDSKPGVKLSTLDKIKIKVNTETYADPRAVVASRRAARGYYYPDPPQYVLPPTPPQPAPKYHYYPRPRSSSKRLEKEVVVLLNPYRLRPASVSSYNARVLTEMAMAGGVSLSDIHPPPVTRTDLDRDMEKRSAVIHALGRPAMLPYYRPYYSMYPWYHSRRYRYPYFRLPSDPYFRVASDPTYRLWSYPYNRLWSDPNYRLWSDPYYRKSSGSTRVRVLASPLPHKRRRRYRIKAALVGSKVDVVLPTGKGRRPRSQYAQSVMRDIKKQEIAQVDDKTTDANVISKNKTRPRPSVTFKRYPSTYVQDMTPKVDDVKRRVKSLLEAYKASDIVKGSAQSIIKQTNDKIYTKNTKSDIKPVSRRKLEEKIEIKTAKEEVPSPQATSSLKAHPRVPHVARRGGKAIRDEDGEFTKPKNLLSWKYRLEARSSPSDFFFTPKTFSHMRDQLRAVRDKMDVHRQLMDRYLEDPDVGRSLGDTGPSTTRSSSESDDITKRTSVRLTSARVSRIPVEIPKPPKRRRFLKRKEY